MSYATAMEIATALGARRSGRGWVAKCPAHDDRTPSFSIADAGEGRPLVYCFSGCDQKAVLGALRERGLWGTSDGVTDPSRPLGVTYRNEDVDRERQTQAHEIWTQARPFRHTLAENYLRARRVTLIPRSYSTVLRFAPALRHSEGWTGPAMIAAIQDGEGRFTAIQRTWMARDGQGKAPLGREAKKTLGPMRDGAVKLMPASDTLGLAEGIETACSAAQLYSVPVWATLSCTRLGMIRLPECVRTVIIFADANEAGLKAAFAAAEIYERQGLAADVIPPSVHYGEADDFNTALQAMAA